MGGNTLEEMKKRFGKLNESAGKAASYRLKRGGVKEIPLELLEENPLQPRKMFDENSLKELAVSMERHGLLQPVIAYESKNGKYVLVAGHRRAEAARRLGWKNVKAVILSHVPDDAELAEKAIAENFARKNLSPVEMAVALVRYKESNGLSYEEAAKRVGMSKTAFLRYASILKLPGSVIERINGMDKVDLTAVSMLNGLEEETAKRLFEGYLENGREWLKEEVAKLRGKEENAPFFIKRTAKTYNVRIKKEAVDEKALETFLSLTPEEQKRVVSGSE